MFGFRACKWSHGASSSIHQDNETLKRGSWKTILRDFSWLVVHFFPKPNRQQADVQPNFLLKKGWLALSNFMAIFHGFFPGKSGSQSRGQTNWLFSQVSLVYTCYVRLPFYPWRHIEIACNIQLDTHLDSSLGENYTLSSMHSGLFSKYLIHAETFRAQRVAWKTDKTLIILACFSTKLTFWAPHTLSWRVK